MLTSTQTALATLLAAGFLLAVPSAAEATKPAREPFLPAVARTTEASLERDYEPVTVVRPRSYGREAAVFRAAPRPVEEGAVLEVEISSQRGGDKVVRWECLAVRDLAECFPRALRVPYLPGDDQIALTITAKPRTDPAIARRLTKAKTMVADVSAE